MWRLAVTIAFLLLLWSCGTAQPALTPAQAATATAVSAFATFDAQPADIKQATMTAVMGRILHDLDATPTPKP